MEIQPQGALPRRPPVRPVRHPPDVERFANEVVPAVREAVAAVAR